MTDQSSPFAGALHLKEFLTFYEAHALRLGFPMGQYGAVLSVDDGGTRWTSITEDIEYHNLLMSQWSEKTFDIDGAVFGEKYYITRLGWPDEWEEITAPA